MAKSNSNNENTKVESVELYIIETLLKGANVIIPDMGHLELKSFDDRRTVLFKPTDNTDSFLQVMSVDGEKVTANMNNIISLPLKEGKIVNLPKIGIFRPTKREDDKIHVSFILSSFLRNMLNKKEGEQNEGMKEVAIEKIDEGKEVISEVKNDIEEIKALPETTNSERNDLSKNDIRAVASITEPDLKPEMKGNVRSNGMQLKQNSNLVNPQKNVQTNKTSVQLEDKRERRSPVSISGILLFIVAAIILVLIVVSFIHSRNVKAEGKMDLILPTESVSLPALAEQHYGHSAFWIYIYKANRDKLSSPINIPKNVSLVIPDLTALRTEYDVTDVNDSMQIRRANILADIVLKERTNSDNNTPVVTIPVVPKDSDVNSNNDENKQ